MVARTSKVDVSLVANLCSAQRVSYDPEEEVS